MSVKNIITLKMLLQLVMLFPNAEVLLKKKTEFIQPELVKI